MPHSQTYYTRRRFGGRQPLCAIGVTSRIDVMLKPIAANARSALSRPEPGPCTSIFKRFHAVLLCFFASIFCGDLCGIWCRFPRAFETHCAQQMTMRLRCLERQRSRSLVLLNDEFHMRNTSCDIFGDLFLATTTCITCHIHSPPYFFLPAIGFAGPLRVRAFVCVR